MDAHGTRYTHDPKETTAFGRMVGQWFREKIHGIPQKSFIVFLTGELGAGKTTWTQGVADGLGIADRLVSPTFVLERDYAIPDSMYMLHHFDLYRMNEDMPPQALGLVELMQNPGSIIIIEWPERLMKNRPENYMTVTFTVEADDSHMISWSTVGVI